MEASNNTVYAKKNYPKGCTPPPLCMPVVFHDEDLIEAYHNYYVGDKKEFAKWNHSPTPQWYIDNIDK